MDRFATATANTTVVAAVRTAAREAADSWQGWDWAHDPGGVVVTGPGVVADWDAWQAARAAEDAETGDDGESIDMAAVAAAEREYGEDCQGAASAAADEGREAVALAESGDLAGALAAAKRAERAESEYGGAPSYSPLVTACRDALEAAEVQS